MTLVEKAAEAMKNAYAPYSKFSVGAAVVGDSGKSYSGCNVENACYPAGICAERTAITQAIAQGEKKIKELALITSSDRVCFPCGICLQVISEFATPDLVITSVSADQKIAQKFTLKDFLPHAYDKSFL